MVRTPRVARGAARACAWTLADVVSSRRPKDLVPVKRSANRWFMYNETGNADLLMDASDAVEQLAWKEVLAEVERPAADDFVYYTGPLAGPAGKASATWISSPRSGTRAHYDAFDNEFFQLKGKKRVRVHAPTEHFALHVFPDAHARARKSQVDSDAPDLARFPLYAEVADPVLDVVLEPGDAMTIPAFWFHEIESLTPSVSVNSFSMSPVASVAGRAFANPLPLDSALLNEVVLQCTGIEGPVFIERLLQSRFEPIYGKAEPREVSEEPPGSELDKAAAVSAFQTLHAACGAPQETDDADARGVAGIVMAHLLELSCVRRNGPEQVQSTLSGLLQS